MSKRQVRIWIGTPIDDRLWKKIKTVIKALLKVNFDDDVIYMKDEEYNS